MAAFRSILFALALLPAAVWGQASGTYPGQAVRMIVPYPPGGATDIMARLVAGKLQEAWGQPVIVDNKPGASGIIGNDAVAKAAPDGYTVLMSITAIVQLPALKANLPYDVMKDLVPVTQVATTNSVFLVRSNVPAGSLREFVALVKANPGKHDFGTYGVGTSSHIQGSLLNLQAGIDLTHVPYKGAAPLLQEFKGGQLTSAFIDMATATPHLAGFKALAVTGAQRNPALPNVPTFAELGFHSFDPLGWIALFAPAGMPAPILHKLTAETSRIVRLPDVAARIESLGMMPGRLAGEEFARVVRSDAQVYAKIIRDANIRLD